MSDALFIILHGYTGKYFPTAVEWLCKPQNKAQKRKKETGKEKKNTALQLIRLVDVCLQWYLNELTSTMATKIE